MKTPGIKKMLMDQGVAAKAAQARNRLISRVLILFLVMTLAALFCVWSRVKMVQLGYELSALQREAEALSKVVRHLNLEVETLKSPARLKRVASEVLEMRIPSGEEVVLVKKEESNGYKKEQK